MNLKNGIGNITLSIPLDHAELARSNSADGTTISEDGRYVFSIFRALSVGIIPSYFLNITEPVLKASTKMLKDKTIYPNHHIDVKDWAGVVIASKWNDGEEKTPAGINVQTRIDAEQAPWAARGLTSPPPKPINSVSVGMRFDYQCSICGGTTCEHLFDKWGYLNYDVLGTKIEGKLVTIDLTKITGYDELSLVWEGADPNAKEIATLNEPVNEMNIQKGERNKMEFEAMKAQLEAAQKKEVALTADLAKVAAERDAAKAELEAKAELIKNGEAYLTQLRTETEKHYRFAKGEDKIDDAMIKLIASAGAEQLKALHADYLAQSEERVPQTCKDCGSKNLSRRSSDGTPDTKDQTKLNVDIDKVSNL